MHVWIEDNDRAGEGSPLGCMCTRRHLAASAAADSQQLRHRAILGKKKQTHDVAYISCYELNQLQRSKSP